MHASLEAVRLRPGARTRLRGRRARRAAGTPPSRGGGRGTRADLRRLRNRAAAARAAHVPLGAPAAERRARRVGAGAARPRNPARTRAPRGAVAVFRPAVALPFWVATYIAWHLPWVYDYALRHPHSLLHVEHAMYLARRHRRSGGRSCTARTRQGSRPAISLPRSCSRPRSGCCSRSSRARSTRSTRTRRARGGLGRSPTSRSRA